MLVARFGPLVPATQPLLKNCVIWVLELDFCTTSEKVENWFFVSIITFQGPNPIPNRFGANLGSIGTRKNLSFCIWGPVVDFRWGVTFDFRQIFGVRVSPKWANDGPGTNFEARYLLPQAIFRFFELPVLKP